MVALPRVLFALLFVLLAHPGVRSAPTADEPASSYSELEEAVLREMNLLRRDPRAYAAKLLALRPSYHGNRILRGPDEPAIATVEGVAALDEAVRASTRSRWRCYARRTSRACW